MQAFLAEPCKNPCVHHFLALLSRLIHFVLLFIVLTIFYRQHFGARKRAPEILLPATTSSSLPSEMERRTRSHTQHSDLPPPSANPIQEQGNQQDLNSLHTEEVHGKEPMAIADDGANLGELTRHAKLLEEVIGAVQSTINQLNQFLIQATDKEFNSSPLWWDQLNKPLALILGDIRGLRRKLTSLRLSL